MISINQKELKDLQNILELMEDKNTASIIGRGKRGYERGSHNFVGERKGEDGGMMGRQ